MLQRREEGEEQRLQVIRQCDERMMEVREARRGYVQGSAWDEGNMIQAMATGLLPQEPRELWHSFPQDPALCRAPFWHEPALLSHGKIGPRRCFFRKNVGVTKSPFPPGDVTFFRRKNADFTARAVRFLEKNGGLVV